MGGKKTELSAEDELAAILEQGQLDEATAGSLPVDDGGARAELDALTKPKARSSDAIGHGESMPVTTIEGTPPEKGLLDQFLELFPKTTPDNPLGIDGAAATEQLKGWDRASTIPGAFRAGGANLGELIGGGMMLGGGGLGARIAQGAAGAALSDGSRTYERTNGDASAALHDARDAAGGDALTNLVLGGAGEALGAAGNRSRMASWNATRDDLRELGMTPAEFSQMTDELGVNRFGREAKLDAVSSGLDAAGQQGRASIAAADAAGIGANRDWGGEIARDVDQNAMNVFHGGSGQRGAIINKMRDVAAAAEDHPMDSLADLRAYKTARAGEAYKNSLGGLDESAAGKAALAAADSATQHLDNAMFSSGAENYRQYVDANDRYHGLSALEELVGRGEPSRGPVGDVVAAGIGAGMGGGPGAAAAVAGKKVLDPYVADIGAVGLSGASQGLNVAGRAGGMSATEQLQSARNQARGQEIPNVVENLLQQPPPWFQPYAQVLGKAKEDGTLEEKLYQLENTDQNWKRTVLPQLQQLSASQ